jgi:hypothetical protein
MADDWITTREATELSGYRADYLRTLIRQGRVKGRKYFVIWQVERRSLLAYLREQEKRACTEKPIRANAAEKNVWEYIERHFSNLDRLGDELKAAQQDEFDRQEPKRVELENVEAMLADAERDAEKIARAMKDAEEGAVKRSLQRDEREVNARCDELTKRRDKLQAELGARLLTDERIARMVQYARDVREEMENPTFDDKRRYLQMLGAQAQVEHGRVWVSCVLNPAPREVGIECDLSILYTLQ